MNTITNTLITVLGTITAAVLSAYIGRGDGHPFSSFRRLVPFATVSAIVLLVGFASYDQATALQHFHDKQVPELRLAVANRDKAIAQLVQALERVAADDIKRGGHPGEIYITVPAPPP